MEVIRILLRHSRRDVILGCFTGALSGFGSTAFLGFINRLITNEDRSDPRLILGFLGLCILLPAARVTSELLLTRLGQQAIFKLRLELSRHLLAVPLRRLEQLGPHRLLSTLADDVPAITNFVGMLPNLLTSLAVLLGCLVYLGWLSWQGLLLVFLALAVGGFSYQLPILKAQRYFRAAREFNDDLYHHLRALVEGTKELKLHRHRRQAFLTDDLETSAASFRDQSIAGFKIYSLASSWGQLLVFVVVAVVLFLLPGSMGPAVLTGYALTLLYLMTPLQMLMNTGPILGRANVALRRVEKMGLELRADASEESHEIAGSAPPAWQRLEFLGVIHSYGDERDENGFAVGPIDLTLEPGELVFVAGGNGAGKTTLAKLLTGLYTPDAGEIRLNGEPVTDANRQAYREHFSVVFSDFYLFETLLGLEGPEFERRTRETLEKLLLANKVEVREGRFSTTELSQGQRKRLALLQTWLEDRPLYLFDEWAADQDPYFKEIFYKELLPSLKALGKTAVVITHDDRYYDLSDRIIKLENGRVVATTPVSSR